MADQPRTVSWPGPTLIVVGLLLAVIDALGWFVLWWGAFPAFPIGAFIGWATRPFWTLVLVVAVTCIAAGFWSMRRTPPPPISRR